MTFAAGWQRWTAMSTTARPWARSFRATSALSPRYGARRALVLCSGCGCIPWPHVVSSSSWKWTGQANFSSEGGTWQTWQGAGYDKECVCLGAGWSNGAGIYEDISPAHRIATAAARLRRRIRGFTMPAPATFASGCVMDGEREEPAGGRPGGEGLGYAAALTASSFSASLARFHRAKAGH